MLDPSKQRKGVTSFLGSVVGGAGSVMVGERWGDWEMGRLGDGEMGEEEMGGLRGYLDAGTG
jgi:hypothetical protein